MYAKVFRTQLLKIPWGSSDHFLDAKQQQRSTECLHGLLLIDLLTSTSLSFNNICFIQNSLYVCGIKEVQTVFLAKEKLACMKHKQQHKSCEQLWLLLLLYLAPSMELPTKTFEFQFDQAKHSYFAHFCLLFLFLMLDFSFAWQLTTQKIH